MGEDGGDLGDLAAHLGLELGDEGVGGAEGHGLVDLEVLLDVERCGCTLNADVVDVEVGAGGDGRGCGRGRFRRGRRWGRSGRRRRHRGGGAWTVAEAALVICSERWKVRVAGHAEGDVGEVVGAGAAECGHGRRRGRRRWRRARA